jgi:N-acetylglucosamine-6-phosphate deacetylase
LTPTRQLGRDSEIGSIDTGKLADFVVCDETLQREAVYLGGVKLS